MSVYKCHAFIFLDQPPPWPSRTRPPFSPLRTFIFFRLVLPRFSGLFFSSPFLIYSSCVLSYRIICLFFFSFFWFSSVNSSLFCLHFCRVAFINFSIANFQINLEEIRRDFGDKASFALQLLSGIYSRTERKNRGGSFLSSLERSPWFPIICIFNLAEFLSTFYISFPLLCSLAGKIVLFEQIYFKNIYV